MINIVKWIKPYSVDYSIKSKTVIMFEENVLLSGLSHQQASVVCGALNGAYNLGRQYELLNKD